jgi:hypothetical protein
MTESDCLGSLLLIFSHYLWKKHSKLRASFLAHGVCYACGDQKRKNVRTGRFPLLRLGFRGFRPAFPGKSAGQLSRFRLLRSCQNKLLWSGFGSGLSRHQDRKAAEALHFLNQAEVEFCESAQAVFPFCRSKFETHETKIPGAHIPSFAK